MVRKCTKVAPTVHARARWRALPFGCAHGVNVQPEHVAGKAAHLEIHVNSSCLPYSHARRQIGRLAKFCTPAVVVEGMAMASHVRAVLTALSGPPCFDEQTTPQVEMIQSATPEYDADDLAEMTSRQLRSVMLQAGIDVEGCLEKADLLERVLSSRLIRVTHQDPPQPPPPPAASSTSGEGNTGARSTGSNQSFSTTREQQPTTRRSWWGGRPRPAPAPTRVPTAGGWNDDRSPPITERRPERPVPPTTEEPRRAEEVASSLESMSVKELTAITSRLRISTAGCIEKRDVVERIRGSGRYHPEQGGRGGAGFSP